MFEQLTRFHVSCNMMIYSLLLKEELVMDLQPDHGSAHDPIPPCPLWKSLLVLFEPVDQPIQPLMSVLLVEVDSILVLVLGRDPQAPSELTHGVILVPEHVTEAPDVAPRCLLVLGHAILPLLGVVVIDFHELSAIFLHLGPIAVSGEPALVLFLSQSPQDVCVGLSSFIELPVSVYKPISHGSRLYLASPVLDAPGEHLAPS
mmetsp:Transcript_36522/g.113915  ORF Transcript_36522/g.113915 Transcript_36522/m.113915 type:complete len:203 (+) Transcript_36522:1864-2472(+)